MGGDVHSKSTRMREMVSIHASAWEATTFPGGGYCNLEVSIHASAWEATSLAVHRSLGACRFNPRLRMGGDAKRHIAQLPKHGFNPRLRMGGDRMFQAEIRRKLFQSTPPHGRRPESGRVLPLADQFQSTPPHGRRPAPIVPPTT